VTNQHFPANPKTICFCSCDASMTVRQERRHTLDDDTIGAFIINNQTEKAQTYSLSLRVLLLLFTLHTACKLKWMLQEEVGHHSLACSSTQKQTAHMKEVIITCSRRKLITSETRRPASMKRRRRQRYLSRTPVRLLFCQL
jgi:hypothetical protein